MDQQFAPLLVFLYRNPAMQSSLKLIIKSIEIAYFDSPPSEKRTPSLDNLFISYMQKFHQTKSVFPDSNIFHRDLLLFL